MIRFSLASVLVFAIAGCSLAPEGAETNAALGASGYAAHVKVDAAAPSTVRWRAGSPEPSLSTSERAALRLRATRDAAATCDVLLGRGAWVASDVEETVSSVWDGQVLDGLRYSLKVEETCSARFPSAEAFYDRLFVAADGPELDTPAFAVSFARGALVSQPASAWRYLAGVKLAAVPHASLRDYGAFLALREALIWGPQVGQVRTEMGALAKSTVDRQAFVGVFALYGYASEIARFGEDPRQIEASQLLLEALAVTRDAPADAGFGRGATLRTFTLEALDAVYPCGREGSTCFGRSDLRALQALTVRAVAPSLATGAAYAAAVLARGGEEALTFAETTLRGAPERRADGARVIAAFGVDAMSKHVSVQTLARAFQAGAPVEQRAVILALRLIADDVTHEETNVARRALVALCMGQVDVCAP